MQFLKYFLLIIFFTTLSYGNMKNAYDFSFVDINNGQLNLSKFKGKPLLITNVASKCGFTNQYSGLQSIWDKYKAQGLVVIGIPSNDFNQELKTKEEVKKFCEVNFNINFPMTGITKLKGENAHPFYKWVAKTHGKTPKWNFYKILIDKNGHIVDMFSSLTKPESAKLKNSIEKVL